MDLQRTAFAYFVATLAPLAHSQELCFERGILAQQLELCLRRVPDALALDRRRLCASVADLDP